MMRNTMVWTMIVTLALVVFLGCTMKRAHATKTDRVAAVEALFEN